MIVSVSTTTKLYSNFLLRSSTISATDNKFRSSLYSTIRTGVVTKYDPVKKWGFIRPDNGATDVYVHQTAIYADGFRMLNVGERVEYTCDLLNEYGRPKAIRVTGPNGNYVAGKQFRGTTTTVITKTKQDE